MLKKRIIACLIVKQGIVVQSIGFQRYLPVGKPEIAVEFLNRWGIDEIVLLDIDAIRENRLISLDLIRRISHYCFVPLTVGGGIRTVEDMKKVIQSGADKVAINNAAIHTPELITKGQETFGRQCVVVSMDARKISGSGYEVFIESGQTPTGFSPRELAIEVERLGAGEIFLSSIDNDGAKQGYDLDLVREVAGAVNIPLIICSGAGNAAHLAQGLEVDGISAVAAANFFHYTEHSVTVAKSYIESNCSQPVRLETYAHYREFGFDDDARLNRKSDPELAELLFEYHPKEVI